MNYFVARRPVGTAHIEWIEDEVTTFRTVELGRVFKCRVIDDGRFPALHNLHEQLPLKSALTGARVAHDHHVAALKRARDANHLASRRRREADTVSSAPPIELLNCDNLRAFQPPAILAQIAAHAVTTERPHHAKDEYGESASPGWPRKLCNRLAVVDPLPQYLVHLSASVVNRVHNQIDCASFARLLGQNKGYELTPMFRRGHNVRFGGHSVLAAAIDCLENRVVAPCSLEHFGIQVFVPVVALQRCPDRCVRVNPDAEADTHRKDGNRKTGTEPGRPFRLSPKVAHAPPQGRRYRSPLI